MYTFAKIGGVTNLESMNKTVIWKFWWKNVFGKKVIANIFQTLKHVLS